MTNGWNGIIMNWQRRKTDPPGAASMEGMPSFHGHLYGVNGAGVTQEFIAYVLDYEEESGMATLEVRNNFRGHIAAEVFGPTISATRFELQELYDMDGNLVGRCQNTNAENQNPCTPASGKGRP